MKTAQLINVEENLLIPDPNYSILYQRFEPLKTSWPWIKQADPTGIKVLDLGVAWLELQRLFLM